MKNYVTERERDLLYVIKAAWESFVADNNQLAFEEIECFVDDMVGPIEKCHPDYLDFREAWRDL